MRNGGRVGPAPVIWPLPRERESKSPRDTSRKRKKDLQSNWKSLRGWKERNHRKKPDEGDPNKTRKKSREGCNGKLTGTVTRRPRLKPLTSNYGRQHLSNRRGKLEKKSRNITAGTQKSISVGVTQKTHEWGPVLLWGTRVLGSQI